jgi:hypothetical protein
MRQTLLALALISLALWAQTVPASPPQAAAPQPNAVPQRKIPCKVPENASMCYWTRGRLSFYEGNPAYRIWKVGTKRILGIYSGPDSERIDALDNEHPEFPTSLDRVFGAEYKRNVELKRDDPYLVGPIYADFEICPVEPEKPGTMQSVCIESAKNMFAEMSKRGYR